MNEPMVVNRDELVRTVRDKMARSDNPTHVSIDRALLNLLLGLVDGTAQASCWNADDTPRCESLRKVLERRDLYGDGLRACFMAGDSVVKDLATRALGGEDVFRGAAARRTHPSESGHFVSASCEGHQCPCGAPATHKVGEEIPHDEPPPGDPPLPGMIGCWWRHNLTAYVCCACFKRLLGPAVPCPVP